MIPSIILEEAKTFVTFMQSMVEELIGNEEVMLAIARANGNISEEEAQLLGEDTAAIKTEEDLKKLE